MTLETQAGSPEASSLGKRSRWSVGVAGLLLTLFALQAISTTREESNTFDEPLHITTGYLYWSRTGERLWPENGVLSQAWCALPLLFNHENGAIVDGKSPQNMGEWGQGYQFFYGLRNDPATMLLQARAMACLLAVALGALIFVWSSRLFGAGGGLISLFLFSFCPTFLAHGALATTDTGTALCFLAATYFFWEFTHAASNRNLALSLLATSALVLCKMSSILIVPVFVLIVLVRVFSEVPIAFGVSAPRAVRTRKAKAAFGSVVLAAHAAAVVAVLWSAYDFPSFDWGQEALRRQLLAAPDFSVWTVRGLRTFALEGASRFHLLPHAYIEGMSYQLGALSRGGFLWGTYAPAGRWWFFPFAFLVKTPLCTLILIGLALPAYAFSRRAAQLTGPDMGSRRPTLYELSPLIVLFLVYAAGCVASTLNIGNRHIMALYAVMFIAAGANRLWVPRFARRRRLILAVLLAGVAAESLAVRPHYLAFFNRLAGGPRNGYHLLVDSSLDWGQDLPGLRQWLARNTGTAGIPKVYLSYFGTADPAFFGIHSRLLPGRPGSIEPLEGGLYCISASNLETAPWTGDEQEAFGRAAGDVARWREAANDPDERDLLVAQVGRPRLISSLTTYGSLRFLRLCAYLRSREPDDEIGYSILVFRLSDAEIQTALGIP
jgi:Dolichyl-phosphate-mannose-protein mannosyltransferase